MSLSLTLLAGAFAGGLFGAAIGALPAFIFTGFAVLIGAAVAMSGAHFDFLGTVAFGPIFGPHIAFAGGVAAAAFAARQKQLGTGKDIASALMGLGKPAVLLVGGIFGIIGLVLAQIFGTVLGNATDAVALAAVVSAVIARLIFGRTGIFGTLTQEAKERGRFRPGGDQVWLPYQQKWAQVVVIGLGAGLLSAWAALEMVKATPQLSSVAVVLGFGISAASLLFLQFGVNVPVTHHITLIAARAALLSGSLFVGALFGIIAALVGELSSRLLLIHGDTHIDPPANTIWVMTFVVHFLGVAAIL